MTQLQTLNAGLPAFLQNQLADTGGSLPSELEDNVRGSFAIVSTKGKVFSIKFGGESQQVLNEQGFPAQYLDVVLVNANAHLNKTYYATTFNEDSAERPDCWSDNGETPAGSHPVHSSCATCPKNIYGSRVSDNGSKGKACSDTRKVVVLPIDNLHNERFGGGMMLRISPTGLSELSNYNKKLRSANTPYFAVVTRLTFDSTLAYPKLQFTALRYLTEAEFAIVTEARTSDHVHGILEQSFVEAAEPADTFSTMGTVPAHVAAAAQAAEAPAPVAEPVKRATRQRTAPVEAPPQAAPVAEVITAPARTTASEVPVPEDLTQKLNSLFG